MPLLAIILTETEIELQLYFQGKHISHKQLGFTPQVLLGVTCSADYIFVAEYYSSNIHVFNWHGEEFAQLSIAQLQQNKDQWVQCLHFVHNGSLLIVAVGKLMTENALNGLLKTVRDALICITLPIKYTRSVKNI